MKTSFIFIGAMLLLLAGGCANELKPAAGMSGLRVKVAAEPKKGLESAHVQVYDSGSTDVGTGAFERVDYSNLGDVAVWVEDDSSGAAPADSYIAGVIDLDGANPKPGLSGAVLVGAPNLVEDVKSLAHATLVHRLGLRPPTP